MCYKSQFNNDSKLNQSNMLAMITALISIPVCLHLMRVLMTDVFDWTVQVDYFMPVMFFSIPPCSGM